MSINFGSKWKYECYLKIKLKDFDTSEWWSGKVWESQGILSGCSGTVVALKNDPTSHVLATIMVPLHPTVDCKVCAVVCFLAAKHKSANKIHHKLNCVLGEDVMIRPMASLCTHHLLNREVHITLHFLDLNIVEDVWRVIDTDQSAPYTWWNNPSTVP